MPHQPACVALSACRGNLLNHLNSHPYELLLRKPQRIISLQNIGGVGGPPETSGARQTRYFRPISPVL